MSEPISKSVSVKIDPTAAFEQFTNRIGDWWPGDSHSVSAGLGQNPAEIVLEPRKDGAVYEVTSEGMHCEWGRILTWSPGKSFSMSWYPGRDPSQATEVTLLFQPDNGGCRVELTHRGWVSMGAEAEELYQRYQQGWDRVLGECFSNSCK